MLNISNLDVYYGESIIIKDINLEVPEKTVVCLMGRNGVGKTTLLKSIMGLLKPRTGVVKFNGEDITGWPPEKRAQQGIGYVPQGRDIFPQLTVYENLLLGLETQDRKQDIPEEIYQMFPVLKTMLSRRGGDLSGGQQQQLAIARALLMRPKLLLLDEPTEGIQPSIILDIAKAIRAIREESNISILLVEQYLDFALELADYFYIMEKGIIVFQGYINQLTENVVKEHLAI